MEIYSIERALKIFSFRNKYDVLSNRVANEIFEAIKNRIDSKINFKDSIYDQECIIDFAVIFNKEYNKKMEIKAVFTYPVEKDIDAYVDVRIYLKSDFAKHDLERLYYRIYEAIRHEYEHFDKYLKEEVPSNEYKEVFDSLEKLNIDGIDKVRLMVKYILDPIEIDSYAKSIMYIAKKRKIAYGVMIDEIIKRAMFNDSDDIEKQMQQNSEVVGLINQVKNGLIRRIQEIYPSVVLRDVF